MRNGHGKGQTREQHQDHEHRGGSPKAQITASAGDVHKHKEPANRRCDERNHGRKAQESRRVLQLVRSAQLNEQQHDGAGHHHPVRSRGHRIKCIQPRRRRGRKGSPSTWFLAKHRRKPSRTTLAERYCQVGRFHDVAKHIVTVVAHQRIAVEQERAHGTECGHAEADLIQQPGLR